MWEEIFGEAGVKVEVKARLRAKATFNEETGLKLALNRRHEHEATSRLCRLCAGVAEAMSRWTDMLVTAVRLPETRQYLETTL